MCLFVLNMIHSFISPKEFHQFIMASESENAATESAAKLAGFISCLKEILPNGLCPDREEVLGRLVG